MDLVKVCLIIFGAVVALFGITWLCLLLERKIPVRKFDERQQASRAKAYRFGGWVGIVYYFALWVMLEKGMLQELVAEAVFGGILLQALAGYFYMFLTGSELPFSQKPTLMFALYFALGLGQLCLACRNVSIEQAWLGTCTIPWYTLMASVAWLSMGVVHFFSWLKEYCDE